MWRNRFLVVLIVFALCSPAEAQQPKKIGFLSASSPTVQAVRIKAFIEGLRDLGYVETKNIVIEYRYAEGKDDRMI